MDDPIYCSTAHFEELSVACTEYNFNKIFKEASLTQTCIHCVYLSELHVHA